MSEELNENELENVSGGAGMVDARREEESFDEGGREEDRDGGMDIDTRIEKDKVSRESRD